MPMTRTDFSDYVSSHYEQLLRFVRSRIANPHDAEDVLQQTLIRLLTTCAVMNAQAPDGFVFTALRNAIIDYWRHRGRQPPVGPLSEGLAARPDEPGPSGDPATEERCGELLRRAAAELTPRERQAFAAYWRTTGDRAAALERLGAGAATSQEKYRVYDGPLYHAKRKLAHALQSAESLLTDLGHDRVWQLVAEVWDVL
jgi:RNA polymerase sigma factor (sigma-70 family)